MKLLQGLSRRFWYMHYRMTADQQLSRLKLDALARQKLADAPGHAERSISRETSQQSQATLFVPAGRRRSYDWSSPCARGRLLTVHAREMLRPSLLSRFSTDLPRYCPADQSGVS
jgi:hypothetical protein